MSKVEVLRFVQFFNWELDPYCLRQSKINNNKLTKGPKKTGDSEQERALDMIKEDQQRGTGTLEPEQ